ncbi:MAG: PGPGW domain-containing protein, partial [Candidatus Nanopelagicaceae bacterium]
RQQIKSNLYGSIVWRVFIGVIGGLVTIIGTIFLFAPGPGLLVLLAGLGILATEFAWAANAIRKTKSIAQTTSEKFRIPLWVKYLLVAGGALFSIALLVILYA